MERGRHFESAYATKAGVLIHVDEVARGLACDCQCARCDGALVARKGTRRRHHFAHFRDTECTGAPETLLHLLAKEILSQATAIALPAYNYNREFKSPTGQCIQVAHRIMPARRIRIAQALIEQPLGSIRPDVLLLSGSARLAVEIAVTHRVDRAKLRLIRKLNLPVIELRLDSDDLMLSRKDFTQRLIEDTGLKRWLFHPAQRAVEAEWLEAKRKAAAAARKLRRSNQLKPTASPRRGSPAGRTPRDPSLDWWGENLWAERFFRQHGRYPSLAESQSRHRKGGSQLA